jgi:hypothetical protein
LLHRLEQGDQLAWWGLAEQGLEGRQLAALGRRQAIQLGPGQMEHIDPGLNQFLWSRCQQHLGGLAWKGLEIQVRLAEGSGQLQGGIQLAQGSDRVIRHLIEGPDDHPPFHGGRRQCRHHHGIQQVVSHQQVTDQIAEGFLLKRSALEAGEGGQGRLDTDRTRQVVFHHLTTQMVIVQLKEHLLRKQLRSERPEPILQIF